MAAEKWMAKHDVPKWERVIRDIENQMNELENENDREIKRTRYLRFADILHCLHEVYFKDYKRSKAFLKRYVPVKEAVIENLVRLT